MSDVAGGSKNIDNPGVKTAIDAFNKTVKAGQTLELARSSGCLGPLMVDLVTSEGAPRITE